MTKDLLYCALTSRYRCTRNSDSNNQLYSIARTLLGTGPMNRYCIQEVGASQPGAFDPMMALLRPQVAVITNIGSDHFKSFRTPASVAAEKSKLIACLPADGLAVLNADDELVAAMARQCRGRVVTYGLQQRAEFGARVVTARWPERLSLRIHHGSESLYWRVPAAGGASGGQRTGGNRHGVRAGRAAAAGSTCAGPSRKRPLLGRM